jgi:hypothetical protein
MHAFPRLAVTEKDQVPLHKTSASYSCTNKFFTRTVQLFKFTSMILHCHYDYVLLGAS